MNKIRKYQFIAFLEVFEKYGFKTIEEIKQKLNHDLKNDTDIVFQWQVGTSKEDFKISKNMEVQNETDIS